MKDIQFFDQTFKLLLVIAACVWSIFIMLILFADDRGGCTASAFSWLFNVLAWTAGILSALPLFYGLWVLLFWPGVPKKKRSWINGWILGWGVSIFIAVVITFALTASYFGCR